MALPGHSPPPPFTGPRSPSRIMNGHIDTQLPPLYGPPTRSMLPPSPQNYRFPNGPPIPTPSPSLPALNDNRNFAPSKRPGSSMSISSMLGGEPEKPAQEIYANHNSRGSSRQGSISAPAPSLFSAMSPPQYPSKPGLGEYSYIPRSQSPDKMGPSFSPVGARQRSSSSGTPLQRPSPIVEQHHRSTSTVSAPRYLDQNSSLGFGGINMNRAAQEERVRRTSLSGILQRPSSQPQSSQNANSLQDPFRQSTAPMVLSDRPPPPEPISADAIQRNGANTSYDIKPPMSHSVTRPSGPQMSPTRATSIPSSPGSQRLGVGGTQGRTLASILNAPPAHGVEPSNTAASKMARHDSTQSQTDRAIFGDRGKFRQFSPFASSLVSHGHPTQGHAEEPVRKGSDELSQHRALLGLAAESKRGRYSPMPQVMQGAQAQTPVPDTGVKTEHGRVFSGIGGGIGTTPTPMTSSLKRDEGRTPLSEDNLMKMSRSSSGFNKRPRKLHEDDIDVDAVNGGKTTNGRSSKKGKYQHSYKIDLDDMTNQNNQRRSTPLTGFNQLRNIPNTSEINIGRVNSPHHSQSQRASDAITVFKPRKTIKVASVFNFASRAPRRHVGNFSYRPEISQADLRRSSSQKFDISIRPNLIPSFSAAEHINCTYTIHVPKMWLQDKERGLICAEQYLWGSGIYTDDSDPIAAAIHAGFLKVSLGDTVDVSLLSRVIQEQNPKIEWPKDLKIPDQPMDIEPGKDMNITMVVLPSLERYEGSARCGIRSRTWPDHPNRTQHDGVSFGILKVEFANVGTEELRIGRTGASRRERLRMDLEARQRGLQIQKDRIAKVTQKRLAQLTARKVTNVPVNSKLAPTSAPTTILNGTGIPVTRQAVSALA